MYRLKESDAMLNSRILELIQAKARFIIHYWGADDRLQSNSVHKHSFFEVCYVLGGVGIYSELGMDYPLQSGALFLSRPGYLHQIQTTEGLSILYVAFEPDPHRSDAELLARFQALADAGTIYVENGAQSPTAQLWESLLLREDSRYNLPESALPHAASSLILSFLALFGSQSFGHKAALPRDHMILRRAKLYIRDNLSKPLSLPEMAVMLSVSQRHLSRLFSTGIHENFSGYIRRERIREAARLLIESELPIKEVAEHAGFSSVHYFTRTFTAVMLMSPGQYRRRSAAGDP